MGNFFSRNNSINQDSSCIEEDENGTFYQPKDFNQLLKKIEIISKLENERLFYREINIKYELLDKISKKYGRLKNIKRFFIPIIGTISSGKSTFMNYLLQLNNILEIGEQITTQFICIIRHDEKNEIPELYEVSIVKRDHEAFNFNQKGNNLLSGQNNPNEILKEKIKRRNYEICQAKKNDDERSEKYVDPEDYFLIIKAKIPLFEGEFKDYGELIDFLDIPGLDDNGDTNFNNFIKIIFKNILFPIFIADLKTYMNDAPKDLIKNFIEYYFEKTKSNYIIEKNKSFDIGFYILNKIDLMNQNDKKENIINDFLKNYSSIITNSGEEILINIQQNVNFVDICAKELCNNFRNDQIIREIIEESSKSKYNSFKRFIKNFFKSKYNIDIKVVNKIKEDNELEPKLLINNVILKNNCQKFFNDEPKLNLKEYTYINNQIHKETNLKSDNEVKVKILIQNKIKNMLDDILTFKLNGLINEIVSKEQIQKFKEPNYYIQKFKSEKFIEEFNSEIESLFLDQDLEIDNKFSKIKEILNKIKAFKNYYDKKKISIIFLGKVSSGKTSLMNSIIGHNYNILPITSKENTKNIFILKYSQKEIKLYESQLIENENGNYFEEKKENILINCQEINKNEIDIIRGKIKEINDKNELKYYTLYIPIEALESDKLKNIQDIELIDMPGIKKDLLEPGNIDLENFINLSNGFIFSFNTINIADNDSQNLLINIINYIKNRKDSFDFRDCLFHLNNIDVDEENKDKNIDIFEKEIKKNCISKLYNGNFLERIQMKEIIPSLKFNISYISNTKYEMYQKNVDKIESLDFINNEEGLDSLQEISEFLEDEYPICENESQGGCFNFENNKINEIIDKIKKLIKEENNDDGLLKKIAIHILSILKNKKSFKEYQSSYYDSFSNEFIKQLKFSEENNKYLKQIKFISYFLMIFYYLFYLDSLCLDKNKLNHFHNKITERKKLIETIYKKRDNDIKKKFEEVLKDIKIIEIDITNKFPINLFSVKSDDVIKNFIKKEKIEKIIYETIKNKLTNKLDSLMEEFIKENLSIISSILETNQFYNLFTNLALNFQIEDFKTNLSKMKLYFFLSFLGLAVPNVGGILLFLSWNAFGYYASNRIRLADYFKDIRNNLDVYQKNYEKKIKNIKEKFIAELDNLQSVSQKEIEYLIKRNFHSNFSRLTTKFLSEQ